MVAWARDDLGARFILAEGVVFAPQPEEAIEAAAQAIPDNPWALGAVHSVMTLTGSALLALALAAGRLDTDAAWAAAHVDEDWNLRPGAGTKRLLARRASATRTCRRRRACLALAA